MPVPNKLLLLALGFFSSYSLLRAQTQEAGHTLAGFQASFVSKGKATQTAQSTITDQRRTYLQAFAMRPLTSRQQLGLHLAYLESSMDQRGLQGRNSPFVLERNRALNVGCIQRFSRPLIRDLLQLFFQSTVDFEWAQRKTIRVGASLSEKGLGARYQLRPGVSWLLSKGVCFEFGFGLLNLNTMQYYEAAIAPANKRNSESNFDMSFGSSTVFFGFNFKI